MNEAAFGLGKIPVGKHLLKSTSFEPVHIQFLSIVETSLSVPLKIGTKASLWLFLTCWVSEKDSGIPQKNMWTYC